MALRADNQRPDGSLRARQQLGGRTRFHRAFETLLQLPRKQHAHAGIVGEHEQVVRWRGEQAVAKSRVKLLE